MIDLNALKKSDQSCRYKIKRNHSLKVDMTPMVDLGFLLIAFFIFTAELNRPKVANLYMPAEGKPMKLAESKALTFLLTSGNRIYYYNGNWENAVNKNEVYETGFSYHDGIGNVIREKQLSLDKADVKEGKRGLMMIIKSDKLALYQNFVDILDEVLINDVKKYALVKLLLPEEQFLADKNSP